MNRCNILIIHVGNMKNRGTQALLSSDVLNLQLITDNKVNVTISTTDVQGVKELNLPVSEIITPVIDIPFEKTDNLLRKSGYRTRGLKYVVFSIFYLLSMFFQAFLSIISVILLKIGFRPIYRPNVLDSIKQSDVVISCSDENFKEGSTILPLNIFWVITWWSLLFSRMWDISIAKYFNKPVIMFPNSIGPFRTPIGRFMSRLSMNNCESILIREPISLTMIKELCVSSNIFLTSDSALLYEHKKQSVEATKNQINTIGLSPGFYSHILSDEEISNYIISHAKALDKAIEILDVEILFLPHYVSGFKNDDLDVSNNIYESMENKKRAKIIKTISLNDFIMNLNKVDVHIASKMHPAILATSSFIPTISIAYDHKQIGYFKLLNMDDLLINITNIDYEILYDKIIYIWKNRCLIKKDLKKMIPKLRHITFDMMNFVLKNHVNKKGVL